MSLWRTLYGRDILCLQTWIVNLWSRIPPVQSTMYGGYFVNLASARRGGPSLSHGWFQGCRRLSNGIQLDEWLMRLRFLQFFPKILRVAVKGNASESQKAPLRHAPLRDATRSIPVPWSFLGLNCQPGIKAKFGGDIWMASCEKLRMAVLWRCNLMVF